MNDLKIKRRVLSGASTNCFYVFREGADEIVVIDPGDQGDTVWEDVKSLGFNKIAAILLTHGHGDHTGGVQRLKALSGAPVYAHEAEAEVLKDPRKNVTGWFGQTYGWDADTYLRDGDVLELAGVSFKVIYTPGHTIGGCCFYSEADGVCFCGDTIFNGSVGRTDLPTGSMSQLVNSIREKLLTLPGETKLYTGHGEKTTVEYELQYNPFL